MNKNKPLKEKNFKQALNSFLTNSSKTTLGIPKTPTNKQLNTKFSLVKQGKNFNFVEK